MDTSTKDYMDMFLAKAIVRGRPSEELEMLISTVTNPNSTEILGLPIIEAAKQELLNRSEGTILGEETWIARS